MAKSWLASSVTCNQSIGQSAIQMALLDLSQLSQAVCKSLCRAQVHSHTHMNGHRVTRRGGENLQKNPYTRNSAPCVRTEALRLEKSASCSLTLTLSQLSSRG